MQRKLVMAIALVMLCLVTLGLSVTTSRAQRQAFESPLEPRPALSPAPQPQPMNQPLPTDCAVQPGQPPSRSRGTLPPAQRSAPITLERFRRVAASAPGGSPLPTAGQRTPPAYTPREEIVLIHPTNYGDRFLRDVQGQPVNNPPIVVLHETVASASSTLNFFLTPHPRDEDQASYHTLIRRDGTVTYLVPPDKRAFGAGNSLFRGDRGIEAVRTHPRFPPSVNNFAYHISLETPGDGINNAPRHSGYTAAQYQSLAWLVAKTAVADHRITTHQAVDRSGSRLDPRSFSFDRFFQLLQTYPKTAEIPLQCTLPAGIRQTQSRSPKAVKPARPAVGQVPSPPIARRAPAPP